MISQVHDFTGGMDDTSAGSPARGLTIEVVHPAENTWDRMTAEFADVTYEQTVAYAASRWGNRRLTGIVVREARGDAVAAALAVAATLPLVRAGVAYVKFGPLWRARGREPSPDVLLRVLRAMCDELGRRRGLLVRVVPPADPGREPYWQSALRAAGFTLTTSLSHPERYLIDVTLPAAEQFASLGKRWRAELRKAATDLEFAELGGPAALEEFLSLFRSMMRRKRFRDRHGLPALPALLAHPVASLRMRVFVARHRGRHVAASVIGGAGEILHALFGATADEALGLRAGYALRW